MKLYALMHHVMLPITNENAHLHGYGDYMNYDVRVEAYVFATTERRAGNWFKKHLAHLWRGKPFLNGTSACPQWWVSEVEDPDKVREGLPTDCQTGAPVELHDWFSHAN